MTRPLVRHSRRDRVLHAGMLRRDMVIYHGLTPQQMHRRNRIRWGLLAPLKLVPMPLRTRGPMKRFFWQSWEVEKVVAHAKKLSERHGR